ncbi:hypothetical protein D3C79_686620 [compost metagenome]
MRLVIELAQLFFDVIHLHADRRVLCLLDEHLTQPPVDPAEVEKPAHFVSPVRQGEGGTYLDVILGRCQVGRVASFEEDLGIEGHAEAMGVAILITALEFDYPYPRPIRGAVVEAPWRAETQERQWQPVALQQAQRLVDGNTVMRGDRLPGICRVKVVAASVIEQQTSHWPIFTLSDELARHVVTQVELDREVQELDTAAHDQGDSVFIVRRVWEHVCPSLRFAALFHRHRELSVAVVTRALCCTRARDTLDVGHRIAAAIATRRLALVVDRQARALHRSIGLAHALDTITGAYPYLAGTFVEVVLQLQRTAGVGILDTCTGLPVAIEEVRRNASLCPARNLQGCGLGCRLLTCLSGLGHVRRQFACRFGRKFARRG